MRRLEAALLVLSVGCAHAVRPDRGEVEEGNASYYGPGFYGRRTASGEVLRPGTLTAAHPTLPFGACVRVTVLESGRSVQVRINDRGPFVSGRILDVSETAARQLGMVGRGVVRVRLTACQSAGGAPAAESLASVPAEGAWVSPGKHATRPGHLDADALPGAGAAWALAARAGVSPTAAQAE